MIAFFVYVFLQLFISFHFTSKLLCPIVCVCVSMSIRLVQSAVVLVSSRSTNIHFHEIKRFAVAVSTTIFSDDSQRTMGQANAYFVHDGIRVCAHTNIRSMGIENAFLFEERKKFAKKKRFN